MHRTVKQALGWYAAFRQGPAPAVHDFGQRVQCAPVDPTAHALAMSGVLGDVCTRFEADLAGLLGWATTSDEAACPPDSRLLRALRGSLQEAGLLLPKVKRVPHERFTFADYAGEEHTHVRALDQAPPSV